MQTSPAAWQLLTQLDETYDRLGQSQTAEAVIMPLLHIHIAEGKSPEKKQALMDAVAAAVRTSLDADVKSIRIFLHEFPREHYKGVDM